VENTLGIFNLLLIESGENGLGAIDPFSEWNEGMLERETNYRFSCSLSGLPMNVGLIRFYLQTPNS
jgi:hypothetical protein|tara:strand:- start:4279 stop:4476 length:198 start_codon:yes stop_codon:yes gene_type:complete